MRTDLVQQPNRWYQSLVWGFENTISLISLRKWSFLTLVSLGGKDWSPLIGEESRRGLAYLILVPKCLINDLLIAFLKFYFIFKLYIF